MEKEKITVEELRKRVRMNEHIITPNKSPSLMTEEESLSWERECLEAYLRITVDPKRRPGLMGRINEIIALSLKKKAQKAYDKVYNEAFENEDVEEDDTIEVSNGFETDETEEEEKEFEGPTFENETSDLDEDDDEVVDNDKENEKSIDDDILFN